MTVGDTFKKAQSGSALNIPAAAYNAFVDAARAHRTTRDGATPPRDGRGSRFRIRNDTGSALDRFNIVRLVEPVISPDDNEQRFKNDIVLTAEGPGDSSIYAIVQEPVAVGAFGEATVAGVSIIRIDVQDEADEYGYADGHIDHLVSSAEPTGAQIIWKEPGTGVVWAVVTIGVGAAPEVGYGTTTDADVPYAVDIALTVTDAGGTPILDGEGAPQTIKVWRNATRKALWTDFDAGTIFSYVKLPADDQGHEGCIFSRTEGFRYNRSQMPDDGHALEGGEASPSATEITGDASDGDHFFALGYMYVNEADGEGRAWRPWVVIDPTVKPISTELLDGTYHTDTADVDPGFGAMIIAAGGPPIWTVLPIGSPDEVLTVGPGGLPQWSSGGDHELLDGDVHPDTVDADPVKGDLIVANGDEPSKWDRLPVGDDEDVLMVSEGVSAWLPIVKYGKAALPASRDDDCAWIRPTGGDAFVYVTPCAADGSGAADGLTVTELTKGSFWKVRFMGAGAGQPKEPNVRADQVVPFLVIQAATNEGVGVGCLDDPLGTAILVKNSNFGNPLPPGWQWMDNTDSYYMPSQNADDTGTEVENDDVRQTFTVIEGDHPSDSGDAGYPAPPGWWGDDWWRWPTAHSQCELADTMDGLNPIDENQGRRVGYKIWGSYYKIRQRFN